MVRYVNILLNPVILMVRYLNNIIMEILMVQDT